ncbi:FtsX-like permease family protein [Clostridium mediterraneense]|uniref:FtsX-like permease family protein n=1 Tax=Clostridium mediterraneense TaxID=1805472 RepID=UPI00082D41CF|nr:FtsX-like permease family protein [Clostridium mediterraneense]
MYFKIARNNVVKSFKDYTIYFLTLTFAVCIFYAFNSIEAQQAMLQLSSSQKESMKVVQSSMSYLSVFVSIILGCLIIYANNFLIKKRKKELAVYMTLGMGKTKVSRILLLETVCVGIFSLIIGLVLGAIVSQGLSVLTAKLFTVSMTKFTFIISGTAILKTIIYFAVIYLLVMIFNVVVVSKYKLLDLLVAGRKNEKIRVKSPVVSFLIFIIGLGMLIAAYLIIGINGLGDLGLPFISSIVLGFVGTFLFFFGVSGFLIFIIKRNKRVYFKGLNMFVVRQINNKINTNFVSMSLISLMLFVTISALSTGVSFKNSLEGGLKKSTPFDASFYIFSSDSKAAKQESLQSLLAQKGFKFLPDDKYAYYTIYRTPFKFIGSDIDFSKVNNSELEVMSLTNYNNLRKLEGKAPITLKNGQTLLLANFSKSITALNNALSETKQIQIGDRKYTVENSKVIDEGLTTSGITDNMGTAIVPDSDVKGLKFSSSGVNINYGNADKEKAEQKYANFLNTVNNSDDDHSPYILGATRIEAYGQMQGLTMAVLYIVIYLGVIFLITSAAVLALQQLSEASDNVERYSALRKIGATNRMINKTVFKQILIYFAAPLSLAIVDSAVAIYAINKFISTFGEASIFTSSLIVLLLIVIIYGGYFFSTYAGVKNIVKEKNKK